MLNGEKPDPELERLFDICLILHADHTLNASTFAAREVASTRAHMYSAASAAVGALSGELHGGANYEVMRMLLDIKTEENVESYIKEKFAKSERIMGMGHAVYKTVDPRSQVLKELSKTLSEKTGQPWYDITSKVERVTAELMKKDKGVEIFPNVDLYSASVYYMLGIPMDLNTPYLLYQELLVGRHILLKRNLQKRHQNLCYTDQRLSMLENMLDHRVVNIFQ